MRGFGVWVFMGLLLGCQPKSSDTPVSVASSMTQERTVTHTSTPSTSLATKSAHSDTFVYKVVVNQHATTVEVVTTSLDKQKGLSGRKVLPQGHGMLFLFEEEQPLAFWMKDTLIPLDILYFDQMGRLVQAYYNVAPCTEDPCLGYPSVFPAKYVLEINGGEAQSWGLTYGDSMTFSRD